MLTTLGFIVVAAVIVIVLGCFLTIGFVIGQEVGERG